MKKLKGFLLGLLMCLIAYIIDRGLQNATKMGVESSPSDSPHSGGYRFAHQLLHRLKETTMRRSFMWYLNVALLIIVATMFACQAGAQEGRLRRPVVLSPLLKNNLSFLLETVQERGESEGAYCIVGVITRDTVHLNGIVIPWIDSTSAGSVFYQPEYCPANTVAALHTHPSSVGECRQSPTDDNTLHNSVFDLHVVACRIKDSVTVVTYWRDEVPYHPVDNSPKTEPTGIWTITYRYRRPP